MLDSKFISTGFKYIDPSYYLSMNHNFDYQRDLLLIKNYYDNNLRSDHVSGFRKRAYLKLIYNSVDDKLSLSKNQNYSQTKKSNHIDGGKIRQFKTMDEKILSIGITQSIVSKNLKMIKNFHKFNMESNLYLGLHFIRYTVTKDNASYSSPDWLHIDDEPLVFIHLFDLTDNAIGGDNIIAYHDEKTIKHVIRLEAPLDTLVLNNACYHAVTPLGSKDGVAFRDILLFTVEPWETQYL